MKIVNRQKTGILLSKIIVLVLTVGLLIPMGSMAVQAEEQAQSRTIKIGRIDYDGFFDEQEDGSYTGYGVDYLHEISKYTNWNYEYVYENWDTLMQMVRDGEIDFICHAQKTPQRETEYLFSKYSDGAESSVLYTRNDDERYYYNDFEHFSGMKVAVLKNSYQNNVFAEYALKKGFTYELIEYDTAQDCFDALNEKQVDAVAMGSLALRSDLKIVCRFGADPFYFITGKQNQELMDELDDALGQITGTNPYFQAELYQKYYGSSLTTNVLFTREETEYIQNTGMIKVGLMPNRSPLSYEDQDGNPAGMTVDLMNLIAQKSGLQFEYEFMGTAQTGMDYLSNTDGDLVAGVMASVFSNLNPQLLQSDSLQEGSVVFVGRNGEKFDPNAALKVAIPAGFIGGEDVIRQTYPNFTYYEGDSNEDCLQAIVDGKADVMLQNMYIVRETLESPRYADLQMLPAYSFEEDMEVVALPENATLMSVINKTIQSFSSDEKNNIVISNTVAKVYHTTFNDLIYKYRYPFMGILLLFIICIVLCILFVILKQKNIVAIEQKNTQLRNAVAQADNANLAKSQFLAKMSHEIRTPMNAIVGLTNIAKYHKTEPDKIEEYLGKIEVSSKVLLNIINDVLDMSAIESNKIKIANAPFNLREVLNGISTIYYPQCRQKGIELYMNTSQIEHEHLIGDGLRMNQVLLNLISNAYKFTAGGGMITITVEESSQREEKAFFTFLVEDTGEGMTEEMVGRLFRPFEQESAGTAAKHGGSGLGLSIAKNLIELMAGSISVTSQKGVGTTFKVLVPFAIDETDQVEDADESSTDEMDASSNYDFTGQKVLLAEDTLLNAEIAIELLHMVHMEVDHAKDGQEVVELFEQSAPGTYMAILMDVQMPVMNGYEATKMIRKSEHIEAKTIPIFAMTANAFTEDVSTALNAGMNGHLAKPIDSEVVYATLYKVWKAKK